LHADLSDRRRNPTTDEWSACSLDFTVSEVTVQLLWQYVKIDDSTFVFTSAGEKKEVKISFLLLMKCVKINNMMITALKADCGGVR
jgi:hypothetical protein